MPRNSEVNFRLKPKDHNGHSLIYLQFLYNKQRLFFSFGEKIKPEFWNNNKQRPKRKDLTSADGNHSLYELLDTLQEICEKAYKAEKAKGGIPETGKLKSYLKRFLNQNLEVPESKNNLFDLIDRFVAGEIHEQGKEKSKSTLENYDATKKHLRGFEEKIGLKLTYESIDLAFFRKYVLFLKSLQLSHNTVAKDIKTLKVFMNEAVDCGYTNNLQFKQKKFKVSEIDVENVYLTENEIIKLYNTNFSFNKRLEQVVDLFVFGCFVGLRFSDYSSVRPENIILIDNEYFIKLITKKTGELVVIPCNPIVLNIFEKYGSNPNKLPKSISSQKFNKYLKEACELADFKEKGRLLSQPELPLCDCISSHTARRSFATNYYLQGFPVLDLMKITGHKSERSFLKYIKVSKEDTAKRLNELIKKNWSEKMLKAVA